MVYYSHTVELNVYYRVYLMWILHYAVSTESDPESIFLCSSVWVTVTGTTLIRSGRLSLSSLLTASGR